MSRTDSRIDRELHTLLHRSADPLPPSPDPLAGITRRARTLRRRRVAGAVAGTTAAVLVAVGVPAALNDTRGGGSPAGGSRTATATPTGGAAPSAPATTPPAHRARPRHGLAAGIEGFGYWPRHGDFRTEWSGPVLATWKQAVRAAGIPIGPTDYLWAGEVEPGVFVVALAAQRADHPEYGPVTGLYAAAGGHRAVYDLHGVQGGSSLLSFAEPLKAPGDTDAAHGGWALVLASRLTGLGTVAYQAPGGAWRPARELSGYRAGTGPSPFVLFRRDGHPPRLAQPRDEIRVVGPDGNLRYAGPLGLNVSI